MKRILAVMCSLFLICSVTANAAYSQNDIYDSINNAFTWLENNASPLNYPESASSDYYIMALSRMGKKYDYASYVSITESRNPSTKQDGQRLVMSNTAAGERLVNSFVGMYTYNAKFDSASDIAGAVITLKSCGYEIKKENYDFNYMVAQLLQTQQSNGSFNNDVTTTAKGLIALSFFSGLKYEVRGTRDTEIYNYSTDDAILNAITFLESNLNPEFGYNTTTATAYAIMALDSIGIDADNDPAFSSDGKSLISNLMSAQTADGSFNSSADDTAIAACALTSHLLSMQGKTGFFNFTDNMKADSPLEGENYSASGIVNDINNADTSTNDEKKKNTVTITPLPTTKPEHSAFSEEEYGPYPFVGPPESDEDSPVTSKPAAQAYHEPVEPSVSSSNTVTLIVIMVLCAVGFALTLFSKKYPEKTERVIGFIKHYMTKSSDTDDKTNTEERDLLDEYNKSDKVVSTEELYDPDFAKSLIPADPTEDMSVTSSDTEKNE